jgi:hypothetical protein
MEAKMIRKFESGATRNSDKGKLDYEGFFSPLVLEKIAEYLDLHRELEDGSLRDSDNWQSGIPKKEYMKSLIRHVIDLWKLNRGFNARESVEDALCAICFNAMGYLHEDLIDRQEGSQERLELLDEDYYYSTKGE